MSALFGKAVTAISAGNGHSLALCSDGTVAAWGNNDSGQLGINVIDNSNQQRNTPTAVNTTSGTSALFGKNVTAIVAGSNHSMALCSDHTVAVWGNNYYGQLGDNTTIWRIAPVAVNAANGTSALFGKTVTAITAASEHSLALCSDGTIAAWGSNDFWGQLGDNTTVISRSAPVAVNTANGSSVLAGRVATAINSLSPRASHSMAIYGLRAPKIEVELLEPYVTPLVENVNTLDYSSALGAVRTIRIRNTGDLPLIGVSASLTGVNPTEFIITAQPAATIAGGSSTLMQVSFAPTSVGAKSAALRITSNDIDKNPFRIALTGTPPASTTLTATYNTGYDVPLTSYGFDATGLSVNFALNFAPSPGTNLTVVSNTGRGFINGRFSNIANGATVNLTYNGITYPFVAWYYGGDGNDLVLLWPYTGIAAWGYNGYGQLGDDTTANHLAPSFVKQSAALAGKTIIQVAAGPTHTLALSSEGKIYAWGLNTNGEIGDNTTIDRHSPVAVNTTNGISALFGKTVIAVASGNHYSLALCSDGTVTAWGDNTYGQLGDNTTTQRTAPVAVNTTSGTSALFGKTVTAIAAGSIHAVALCYDGTVASWGYNYYGQLGDNTTTQRNAPVTVNSSELYSALFGKTVMAVTAGRSHCMALCSDGTIAAWGNSVYGQLGISYVYPTQKNTPTPVSTASGTSALFGKTVTAIASGDDFNLALCSDGTISAWGYNYNGQLGDTSNTFPRNFPVAVNTINGTSALFGKTVTAIAAASDHSMALCSDGTIAAWGGNYYGQLGDNSTTDRSVPVLVNTTNGVSTLAGNTSKSIGASGYQSFAIYGATLPEIDVEVLEPTVTALTNNNSTVNYGATTLLTRTLRIRNSGGLPLADISASVSGANASDFIISQPASIVASNDSTTLQVTFAPRSAGAKSATLQIASNDPDENPFRIALSGTGPTNATLTGTYNSPSDVALTTNLFNAANTTLNLTLNFAPTPGTNLTVIRNTGKNYILGQFNNAANGATVNLSYNGTTYPFIAWYYGGDGNDLVLLWPSIGVATWGSNSDGQIGDNSTINRLAPTPVEQAGALAGKTIVQITRGGFHTLALTSEGKVYAWGDNYAGQLGDNSTTQRNVPVEVNTDNGTSALFGKTVVAISAGRDHNLALCSDGTLVSWGYNFSGQVGDNTTVYRHAPVVVNTDNGTSALFGKTVTAIAAGTFHSFALCSDGTLAAWGYNGYGELGDNTSTERHTPVAVNAASGVSALFGKTVTSVAMGKYHSIALCSDGTVAAWGYSSSGQIGNNSSSSRYVPTAVNTASGISALFGKTVTSISAGEYHNLALCSDGTIASWGINTNGQLGDNTINTRYAPVLVNSVNGTSALFGKTVTAISASQNHSLALCSDGTMVAWGLNDSGQLGDNSTTQRNAAVAVNTASGTSALSGRIVRGMGLSGLAANHSLALYGVLSPNIELEVLEPALTSLTNNVSTVDYGSTQYGMRTFRIKNSGDLPLTGLAVSVAGADSADFVIVNQPTSVVSGGGSSIFQVIFAPGSAGVKNTTLQIANTTPGLPPFVIALTGTKPTFTGYHVTFNAADDIAFALNAPNVSGEQLNVTLNFAPPFGTNLTVIRNVGTGFIAGQFSNVPNGGTVNLSYNGTTYSFVAWYYGGDGNDLVLLWPYVNVAAWGQGDTGQLGDNTGLQRSVPTAVLQSDVLAGKTLVQIARGKDHTLALSTEGKVYAWGANASGQLGDNSTIQRNAPVAVNTASGTSALFGKTVIAIAAGDSFSLALCSDNTVVAWGLNTNGQLGDNSTTQRNAPVIVNAANGTSALFGKTVTAISAGNAHGLALCSDNTLVAWGLNASGQLGDNSTTQRNAPVVVNSADGVSALFGKTITSIVASDRRSLALCSDGTVLAWGLNGNGQLGDNSTSNRSVPVAVDTASATSALFGKVVTSIAAGATHTLALCNDGTLVAWGLNTSGQVGDNTTSQRKSPVKVNTTSGVSFLFGKTVTAISAGSAHSIALCSDGTIAAWGLNSYGQLGDNSTTQRNAPVAVSTATGSALADTLIKELGAASSLSNLSLALFYTTAPEIDVEVLEPSLVTPTNNQSTVDFGIVPTETRTIRVNNLGGWPLTGLAATLSGTNAPDFTIVSQPPAVIPAGASATFQITFAPGSEGVKNAAIQIASSDYDENSFQIALTGIKTPAALNSTFNSASDVPISTTALTATNTTLNLTLNFAPAPGTNLTVVRNTGARFITGQFSNIANGATVSLPYNGTNYTFVASYFGGDGNDLVLLWPYTGLAAWGLNASGQLGDSTTTQRNAPASVIQTGVLAGKTIVQIARGASHTLALTSDGKVFSWGLNTNGQLGNGSTTLRTSPVTVSAGSALLGKKVIFIAAGDSHSLALCSDGTLAAWGLNTSGQLGDNTTTQRPSPVKVNTSTGLSIISGKTVTCIAAGGSHSLALCSDGTVAAWGLNASGQLGDNTTTNRLVPVAVNALKGTSPLYGKAITTITAGSIHNLALCSDGTLLTWGDNASGQLGDGTTSASALPVFVNTANGSSALYGKTVAAIASGSTHNLALCTDGTLAAWGLNTNGQLGDNTTAQRNSPIVVNTASGTSALFGKTISAIAAASAHSTALCADGTLVAWGLNTSGQLGDNTTTQRNAPVPVNTTAGTSVLATRIASGIGSPGSTASHSTAIYGLPAPSVSTLGATNIMSTGATLRTDINPSGYTSTAQFQYGADTNYGSTAAITLSPANGSVNQNVSAAITGLAVGTTYHYRATVTANGITTYGADQTFTTNHLPILNLPGSPLLVEATSASGALVNFNATATDSEDGALTPNLSRASGSTFAIGDTIVNASATDSAAETTNSGFTIRVQDTTAPVFTPPPVSRNVNSDAAGNYTLPDFTTTVAATDAVGITTFTQTPTAGTAYVVGNQIPVTLTAKDAANNTRTANFTLIVAQLITLENWRQTHFGNPANAGNAANTFDLDKDGNCNLLEYAFGLNPNQPDRNQLPQPQINGSNIGYNFTEPPGISGITYGAEWSTTLQPGSWTPIPDTGTGNQHIFTLPTTGRLQNTLRLTVTTQ